MKKMNWDHGFLRFALSEAYFKRILIFRFNLNLIKKTVVDVFV